MKAQIIKKFGAPSVFEKEEIPRPTVQQNQVLIQVKATSVNPIDCKIRSGKVPDIAPSFPAVLHGDVAGIVVELGSRVSRFKRGDEVYACGGGVRGRGGALAEYMAVEEDSLAKKPRSLSFKDAAALPLVSITAWEALFLKAKIKAGQKVLIHGGAGGVGHIAVQLAKWAELDVAATVGSKEDGSLVQSFGASHVAYFREEGLSSYKQRITSGGGFDVVFDTVGGKNLDLSFEAAALNGKVVTTVARSTHDLSLMHQKGLSLYVVFMLLPLLHGLSLKYQGEILGKIAQLVDEKKLKPYVDLHSFSIEEIGKAHDYMEEKRARGKIVAVW